MAAKKKGCARALHEWLVKLDKLDGLSLEYGKSG